MEYNYRYPKTATHSTGNRASRDSYWTLAVRTPIKLVIACQVRTLESPTQRILCTAVYGIV